VGFVTVFGYRYTYSYLTQSQKNLIITMIAFYVKGKALDLETNPVGIGHYTDYA
jgi:hypothetical protein